MCMLVGCDKDAGENCYILLMVEYGNRFCIFGSLAKYLLIYVTSELPTEPAMDLLRHRILQ